MAKPVPSVSVEMAEDGPVLLHETAVGFRHMAFRRVVAAYDAGPSKAENGRTEATCPAGAGCATWSWCEVMANMGPRPYPARQSNFEKEKFARRRQLGGESVAIAHRPLRFGLAGAKGCSSRPSGGAVEQGATDLVAGGITDNPEVLEVGPRLTFGHRAPCPLGEQLVREGGDVGRAKLVHRLA